LQIKKKHHTEVLPLAGFHGLLGEMLNYEQHRISELNYHQPWKSVFTGKTGSLRSLASFGWS